MAFELHICKIMYICIVLFKYKYEIKQFYIYIYVEKVDHTYILHVFILINYTVYALYSKYIYT